MLTSAADQPAVRLFLGGSAAMGGQPDTLGGDRCFSAAHHPNRVVALCKVICALLDSGAFTDPPERRLTPAAALTRQLDWERRFASRCLDDRQSGEAWQALALVSYDRLIDETWIAGERIKRRWSIAQAESAVTDTVRAAQYIAGERSRLQPRKLVLACQGVDAVQYAECVAEVLKVSKAGDWIGLGGWCILGRFKSYIPTFWQTLDIVLPKIAAAGVRHVHIFGVMYLPVLGGLVYLADQYGLEVSTDSSAPVLAATRRDPQKAGMRAATWQGNVAWWRHELANLRESVYYRPPEVKPSARQLELFGF